MCFYFILFYIYYYCINFLSIYIFEYWYFPVKKKKVFLIELVKILVMRGERYVIEINL